MTSLPEPTAGRCALRVAALMSGGVDSALAAAMAREAGYDVLGLTLDLGPRGGRPDLASIEIAAEACAVIGIEHHVADLRREFAELVVRPYAEARSAGVTPNPCVTCNPAIKLALGGEIARELGCSHVVTGHYARVTECGHIRCLQRGGQAASDQSYFLYRLTQAQLGALVLPLGGLSKSCVRERARILELPSCSRPSSQDICFGQPDDGWELAKAHTPSTPTQGEIVDSAGRVLGSHAGVEHFTVGQRRGLKIGGGPPVYVLAIDAGANRVVVGTWEELRVGMIRLEECVWNLDPEDPSRACSIQVRYRSEPAPCRVTRADGETAVVTLLQPVYGVAPGQAGVVYDGELVVGGGTIAGTGR